MTAITGFLQAHPTLWQAFKLAITAAATFVVIFFLLKLERRASKRLLAKKDNINLRFVENVVRFAIILLAVQWVVMSSSITQPFGKVLFQGTTVIAAIAGFAAQPVIADLICGLMLSATKPFDIGDRIELEDGLAGIVEDITLRHVVLKTIDTVRVIVPNSKLNGMRLTNLSFHAAKRSIHFRFHVSYDADVRRAMDTILRAVKESPFTVPGKPGPQGDEYGPVYFIEYAESSLVMATTVYYAPTSPTEVVKDDVNGRVKRALEAEGIEIPYRYVNVVMNEPRARRQGESPRG